MSENPVGKSYPRKEGRKKVTGQALYVDDLSFPDMLHGATVRSPVARGKITKISFGATFVARVHHRHCQRYSAPTTCSILNDQRTSCRFV